MQFLKRNRFIILNVLSITLLYIILMFLTPCILRSQAKARLAEVLVNKDNVPITFEKFPSDKVITMRCIDKYLYLISEDGDKEKMFIRDLTNVRPIECKGD